jgi:hypothetical protein
MLIALALPGFAADACLTKVVHGSYGFLLWGTTTASGDPKPIASVGRITFDGSTSTSGGTSGTSSVMFAGYLLGNPLTGTYVLGTDCTVTWKLQDDSGNWQNFTGTYTADGTHISFTQTDPTAPRNGTMIKSPDTCDAQTLRPHRYVYGEGAVAGTDVSVEDGCFVSFRVGTDRFRGVVVDDGLEVLAIRSTPGTPQTMRLRAATSPARD